MKGNDLMLMLLEEIFVLRSIDNPNNVTYVKCLTFIRKGMSFTETCYKNEREFESIAKSQNKVLDTKLTKINWWKIESYEEEEFKLLIDSEFTDEYFENEKEDNFMFYLKKKNLVNRFKKNKKEKELFDRG